MDTDDLKELAYENLLEFYKENPYELGWYFEDE